MRVSVFGLGYVGCVTVGCLTRDGHSVIAVDINRHKVDMIAKGLATVVEKGLSELIAAASRSGLVTATQDSRQAILDSDVSIICVGTPNSEDGALDLTAVRRICETMGSVLREKSGRHVVMNRSTVPAGTAEDLVQGTLLAATQDKGCEVGVLVVPEFLREGCAIADYDDPPFVIVGSASGEADENAPAIDALFGRFADRIHWLPFREAEMLKGLCNVFHAMKVAFANEVGALCGKLSLDGRRVMHELAQDYKLNISPAYLRPGLPFGGSCLPKDLRMMINLSQQSGLDLPLLRGILSSNLSHISRAVKMVVARGKRQVGIDGLSFKKGTDDLRESPLVLIAEHLIGKGYDVRIYDPDVKLSCLQGSNQSYIEEHLPHLSSRLVDSPEELLEHAELVVFTRQNTELREIVRESVRPVEFIDLLVLSNQTSPESNAAKEAKMLRPAVVPS